jgi:lipopolysaccharide/colanic/teichoic acid biosynthesis glycosyltransferase
MRRGELPAAFAIALTIVGATAPVRADFLTLDVPGAVVTHAYDVDQGVVVGSYLGSDSLGYGFVYRGAGYETLIAPNASSTFAYGIEGGNIVGAYVRDGMTFGFSYDGSTYETLRFGDSTNTEAYGISGSNIVGRYFDGSGYHSFLYDGSTYHSLNWLDAAQSRAYGIDGTKIVGSYTGTDGADHGFLYDGSTFTTLSGPSATLTDAMGIDGGRVVGTYFDSGSPYASFLYDGSQTETIVISEQLSAQTYGVDGNTLVGVYQDSEGMEHGFMTTIPVPEPSSFVAFLGCGMSMLLLLLIPQIGHEGMFRQLGGLPSHVGTRHNVPSTRPWKRMVEFAFAVAILPVVLPVLAILIVLVRLTSRGPAIYRQQRVGKGGAVYWILKIRTMRSDAETATGPVWTKDEQDPRVTRVGRVLRKLHLDELPQIWNVLCGEMSLVGPRPERPEFVEVLSQKLPSYSQRLAVLPGITGLAQINLPPDTDLMSVQRKLVLDREYIQTEGFWLDIRILACTALRLLGLQRETINEVLGLRRQVSISKHDVAADHSDRRSAGGPSPSQLALAGAGS